VINITDFVSDLKDFPFTRPTVELHYENWLLSWQWAFLPK